MNKLYLIEESGDLWDSEPVDVSTPEGASDAIAALDMDLLLTAEPDRFGDHGNVVWCNPDKIKDARRRMPHLTFYQMMQKRAR